MLRSKMFIVATITAALIFLAKSEIPCKQVLFALWRCLLNVHYRTCILNFDTHHVKDSHFLCLRTWLFLFLLAPALPKILAPLYHLFGNSSYVDSTWTCRKSHHYVEKHLDDTALNLHTLLHTSSRRPCSAFLLPAESRKRTKSTSTCVHGLVVDSLDISSVKGNSLWLFATEVRIIMKNDDPYLDSTGMRFWSVWRGWKPARISSHMKSQKARFLGKTAVQISIFDRMFELSHLLPLSFVHGLGALLLRPSC